MCHIRWEGICLLGKISCIQLESIHALPWNLPARGKGKGWDKPIAREILYVCEKSVTHTGWLI